MFYQKNDFIGYQHIQCLHPKFEGFNKDVGLFLISVAHAADRTGAFNYGVKFNRKNMANVKIVLPTINDKIDFEFMKVVVRITKKLVMKNVVVSATQRIESFCQAIDL